MGARVPFRMRSAPLPLRTSAAREPPRGRRGTRIANPWKHVESLLPHASPAPHVLIFDLRRRTAVSPRPTAAAILCPPRNNDSFAKKSNHCPPADRLPVLRGETRCPDGGDLFQPLSASGLAFRSASPSARLPIPEPMSSTRCSGRRPRVVSSVRAPADARMNAAGSHVR